MSKTSPKPNKTISVKASTAETKAGVASTERIVEVALYIDALAFEVRM